MPAELSLVHGGREMRCRLAMPRHCQSSVQHTSVAPVPDRCLLADSGFAVPCVEGAEGVAGVVGGWVSAGVVG